MDDGYHMLDNNSYEDVTAQFEQTSRDMEPGALMFNKDFPNPCQIGEPRFDSGLALLDDSRPPFDPLVPLLPEEVCWIIDRAFSCEIAWHTGYTLSQTVFSFLYVHALPDIDPDTISPHHHDPDRARPVELVSVVLRASVLGLLKCCDLAWRELVKGNVYDCEDWQSDKCDVPMSEAFPASRILGILDEACVWVRNSSRVSAVDVEDCAFPPPSPSKGRTRCSLHPFSNLTVDARRTFFSPAVKGLFSLRPLIETARVMLQHVRASPPPPPRSCSPAPHAFDPQFPRVLVSAIPLQPIQLPEQSKVWDTLAGLLDSLEQLSVLIEIPDLSTWDVVGTLRIWQPQPNQSLAYVRSAFQSAIHENGIILNKYLQKHAVDCFLMEALQIPYDSFISSFQTRWVGPDSLPLRHIERTITELLVGRTKSHWYNPPRRRRYCMKSLFDWHKLYATLTDVQKHLSPVQSGMDVVTRLRSVVLMRRLETISDIVLSGFQLSLYSHLACLDEIIEVLPSPFIGSVRCDRQDDGLFLGAAETHFLRRYKWAFMHEYEDFDVPPVGHPNFLAFTTSCSVILQDKEFSPAEQAELAERLLREVDCGAWPNGRTLDSGSDEFVSKMAELCRDLRRLPKSMDELQTWDVEQLVWDPDGQPWFPVMRNRSSCHKEEGEDEDDASKDISNNSGDEVQVTQESKVIPKA
ncbi:Mak10 subunit, NatC N-terminal acetyltransferase-domain-containing protein [Pisolithus croceorrhizus]|nr:Mak10 subunit, NatC N-terminal acetyltransferase-domain-containing protein [Pisolithus croceorrhizus]